MKKCLHIKILFFSFFLLLLSFVGKSETISFYNGIGDQYYCASGVPTGSFQLTISPFYPEKTYLWYDGVNTYGSLQESSAITYPSATTTYTCRIFDGERYRYFYFTVYVMPLKNNYNFSGFHCCGGPGTFTLSGSQTGVTYYLVKNGTHTYDSRTGTGSSLVWSGISGVGTYTVCAHYYDAASGLCEQLMNGSAIIDDSCCKLMGTEEMGNKDKSKINIYPNPSKGTFKIESNLPGDYYIIDETGRKIKQFVITNRDNITDVFGLKPGLYLLQRKDDNDVKKVLVVE